MGVMVTLKYLKDLGGGRWEYRRRVPESIKKTVGKSEWKRVFDARSFAEVARGHAKVDADFVSQMQAASLGVSSTSSSHSRRLAFEAALKRAEGLVSGVVGLDDDDARAVVAAGIASSYPADPEDGSPMGISKEDALTLKALMDPVKGVPGYSLEDARLLYLKERIGEGDDPRRHAARNRLAKLFVRAGAGGLPASTLLVDLTRQHARDVRDHMLTYEKPGGGKVAPGSVKRDLTIMKAMIGHAIREVGLIKTANNPFEVLEVGSPSGGEDDIAARERREPLPDTVIAAMKGKLQGELRLIWGLLDGTGCRLAEVSGLRREDLCDIDGPIPHIIIRPNAIRRLKNSSSRRSVPLFGDALKDALEALSRAGLNEYLFPRYARPEGPTALSQILLKHLRGFTTDKRHATHSLRHNMKDRLRGAGVDKAAQDLVLGHASKSAGEGYGGAEGRLEVAYRALKRVHEGHSES